jgi:hypothetical protein
VFCQTDQQHMHVMELKQRTGLNYSFALQCLAENEWNITTALDSYERLKVKWEQDVVVCVYC